MTVEPFDLGRLRQELKGTQFAEGLKHFPVVDSTNIVALEAAQKSAADGSVYFADEQTAGRGRNGHRWHSAVGDGLYVSVIVRPRMALSEALWLSLATGMAVQVAILEVTGLRAEIRWPNDVLVGKRKCCGVLVESTANGAGMLRHAVIGIGVNVNQQRFPADVEGLATSLRMETDTVWPRQSVLAALLRALDREIGLLESEIAETRTGPGVLERFAVASGWVCGKPVSVAEGGGYTGVTAGLDKRGYLLVRDGDGELRTVLSGSVRAR
jgi:BirA family transcriptional regulator, biotin operon repressor / biotin---[acetyl-CoA-carboxylase] ligase